MCEGMGLSYPSYSPQNSLALHDCVVPIFTSCPVFPFRMGNASPAFPGDSASRRELRVGASVSQAQEGFVAKPKLRQGSVGDPQLAAFR
jgi:hypothetical protein